MLVKKEGGAPVLHDTESVAPGKGTGGKKRVFVISSDSDSTLTEYETEGGEDEQQEIYMMSSALPATTGDDAHVEPQTTRAGVDNDMPDPGLARLLRFLLSLNVFFSIIIIAYLLQYIFSF